MGQRRSVFGLVAEPPQERRVGGVLLLEYLHRDLAVEQLVAGAPHLAHPTDSDALDQPVSLTDGQLWREAHFWSTAAMI